MTNIPTGNGRVVYVTPGVFADGGGYEIVIINGKIVIKPIPPWDDPIWFTSLLIAAALERLAMMTDKAELEPELLKTASAILTHYAPEIKGMLPRLNPEMIKNVPEARYIFLKLFGSDGGGIGIQPNGKIVHIPGWNPEMLIPLIGELQQLAEVSKKEPLKPVLRHMAKALIDGYRPELTKIAEQQHAAEMAHA